MYPEVQAKCISQMAKTKTKKRATLDAEKARKIYASRPIGSVLTHGVPVFYGFFSSSSNMASIYGVSPKAVRDIWNRRTWGHATRDLWTAEERKLQQCKRLKASGLLGNPEKLEELNGCKEFNSNKVLMELDKDNQSLASSDSGFSGQTEIAQVQTKKPVQLQNVCDWTAPNLHPLYVSSPSTECGWIASCYNFSTMLNDDLDKEKKLRMAYSQWCVPSGDSNVPSYTPETLAVYGMQMPFEASRWKSFDPSSVPSTFLNGTPKRNRRASIASAAPTPITTPRHSTVCDDRMLSFLQSEAFEPTPRCESEMMFDPFREDMQDFMRQISLCMGEEIC